METERLPTGSTAARSAEVRALCPGCARSVLRDLEAELDP